MGLVFGYNVMEMEAVVARLISGGEANGSGEMGEGEVLLGEGVRINSLNKTLSIEGRRSIDRKARRKARVRAAKMGVEFVRNVEGMILCEL